MEPVLSVKGREQDEEWAAAWVAEAAGVARAALPWDLEGIALAQVVVQQWRIR